MRLEERQGPDPYSSTSKHDRVLCPLVVKIGNIQSKCNAGDVESVVPIAPVHEVVELRIATWSREIHPMVD